MASIEQLKLKGAGIKPAPFRERVLVKRISYLLLFILLLLNIFLGYNYYQQLKHIKESFTTTYTNAIHLMNVAYLNLQPLTIPPDPDSIADLNMDFINILTPIKEASASLKAVQKNTFDILGIDLNPIIVNIDHIWWSGHLLLAKDIKRFKTEEQRRDEFESMKKLMAQIIQIGEETISNKGEVNTTKFNMLLKTLPQS
ncbi:hypothetical protein [Moorella sp. Hama-1]|uniref:hypothetical protein n=1 Tax=Moorella sp. Hama-1 TaxID=2138101 RepID=UPI000D6589DA|nr:hypothetical protein [Moorella sp. Hama-1]